ncbi:MAG: hypothetical protein OEO79_07125 [Gemmatimonadota bacterium]|nr:hypothetical protein [Gemmatimonadota bacterium]MDH3424387.1 hypothetical protein [Gemmatimonadota bacterium]
MDDQRAVSTTRKVVSGLVFVALIPLVAMAAVMVSARMGDGPSVVFAGGPLVAGELATGPEPDWSFVRDVGTIELQLLDPPKSRLIWIVEHEGKAYVVSGYMGSFIGRLWKRWPIQAERDGRAIIRVDGTRYARTLERIRGGAEVEGVTAELRRKYGFVASRTDIADGSVWLFELGPPSAEMTGVSP